MPKKIGRPRQVGVGWFPFKCFDPELKFYGKETGQALKLFLFDLLSLLYTTPSGEIDLYKDLQLPWIAQDHNMNRDQMLLAVYRLRDYFDYESYIFRGVLTCEDVKVRLKRLNKRRRNDRIRKAVEKGAEPDPQDINPPEIEEIPTEKWNYREVLRRIGK